MKKNIISLIFILSLFIFYGCEDPETALFIDNPEFIPDSGIYQLAMIENVEKIMKEYNISRFKGKRVLLEFDTNSLKATGKILTSLTDIKVKENGVNRVIPDRSRRDAPPYKPGGEPEFEIYIDIVASGGHVSRCLLFDRYYSTVYINFSELNAATGEKTSKILNSESGISFNFLTTQFCKAIYLLIAISAAAVFILRYNKKTD